MTTTCKAPAIWLMSLLSLMSAAACGSPSSGLAVDIIKLPIELVEVSGLALLPGQRLAAIGDEIGQVYEVDYSVPKVERLVSFGQPPIRADFEGLAYKNEQLYAITSKGVLYQQAVIGGGKTRKIKTGLGKQCEIEGLAADPDQPLLWIVCKTALKKKLKNKLNIFAWHLTEEQLDESLTISLDLKTLGLSKRFAPSGLSVDTAGFLVVAAKQRAYVTLSRQGQLLASAGLPGAAHQQTEGVVRDGKTIYLADEGVSGPAMVSRYINGI
ncbi:MAG: hypothetical protein ACI9ON_001867 [Limisphaerales bacterium]|jgi:uncharacterized protein YjiK